MPWRALDGRVTSCAARSEVRLAGSLEFAGQGRIFGPCARMVRLFDSRRAQDAAPGRHHASAAPNFSPPIAYPILDMIKFLLWCILLVLCWPLAILALVLFPIVWLLLLPFRIVGIAVTGVLELIWALFTLPARVVRRLA